MTTKDLNTRFEEAVAIADEMSQASLPQGVQLRLYAYYKQATFGTLDPSKTNAWMQISHLSSDEAKELYIEAILALAKK